MFDQNEQAAVLVWGKYVGSIKEPGIHIVNPCGVDLRRVSTMRKTLDVRDVSVTDHDGNPVFMSGNVAYRIYSAKKSQVDTQRPEQYISDQAPMVLRKVGSRMSYDQLRGEGTSSALCSELQVAVGEAGVQVLKFQLTDLRYSPDIAKAMLGRQQAEVQVESKRKIVMGAAETASGTVSRLKQLGHNFSPENEQRLIHDLLLKNLDSEYKQSSIVMANTR
jgi:regulator of protease activity HflC (stomatin/prohibitin superfamily)